jgi:lactose/L-arabinose transport system ATP-binding protein
MNFLPAVTVSDQGQPAVRLNDFAAILPMRGLASTLSTGTPVTVGLRPEAFRTQGDCTLSLDIEMVEYLGGETLVHARGSGELVTAKLAHAVTVPDGETLQLAFNSQDLLFFDESGIRIR